MTERTGWNPTEPLPGYGRGPAVRAPSPRLVRIPPSRWHEPIAPDAQLVHIPRGGACPVCSAPTAVECYVTQPLLRHGGYGAAYRQERQVCTRCTWGLTRVAEEVRPE